MALVRSRDTKPENLVRRILSSLGVRYRPHRRDLSGRPDFYVACIRTAIFVQGCYWHQHSCKAGDRRPKTRLNYWIPKLKANVERDASNREELERASIKVAYLWTCDTKRFEKRCRAIATEYHEARRIAR